MPEFMEGTVEVPGAGRVKKVYVLVPLGLAGAYVAYRWYRAGQETPDPTADGLYSSEDLSEYGLSTSGGPTTVTGNTGNTSTDATGTDTIDDNAEWSAKAVELLGNQGYDGKVVYAALGEFLARRALDKTEASIARAALAAAGQPPVGRPWSVIEEATTGGTGTPKAPKNLRAWGAHSPTTIGLQWDAVDGAAGYRIYRDLGENIGHSLDTKFSARGLEANTAYSFTVAAMSSTGKTGPQSNKVTLKTTVPKLAAPTGLKVVSATRSSVTLRWNPVKGASEGYRAYRKGVGPNVGSSRDTSITIGGLSPSKTYQFKVAAVAGNTTGPGSAWVTAKTKK